MDDNYDFFISYASENLRFASNLYERLRALYFRVFFDRRQVAPGDDFAIEIEQAIERTEILVALVSKRSRDAPWHRSEMSRAREGSCKLVPVLLPGTDINDAPLGLETLSHISWGAEDDAGEVALRLSLLRGTVPRCSAFRATGSSAPFVIELLTQPILLEPHCGRLNITIDRTSVGSEALVSNAGKRELIAGVLKGDNWEWAWRKDREIHDFILAGDETKGVLQIGRNGFPLRWASGGTLSVVTVRGRKGKWTPFLFRDIHPIGWNIPLGASCSEREFSNPWGFMLRGLYKELLVVSKDRKSAKPFALWPIVDTVPQLLREIAENARRHADARYICDRLSWLAFPYADSEQFERAFPKPRIDCVPLKTNAVIRFRQGPLSGDGDDRCEWPNVLVCFNLFELGIEVVTVMEYLLGSDDIILDGEVIPDEEERRPQLVRMPVALISHEYLRRVFTGAPANPLCLVSPLVRDSEGAWERGLPSVLPVSRPREDEIILFNWDAKKRAQAAKGDPGVHELDQRAAKRHTRWMINFSEFFYDDKREAYTNTTSNPVPWFTPAAAKLMCYYFADKSRHGESAGGAGW